MAPTTTTTTPVRRSARVASRAAAAAAAAESATPPPDVNKTKKKATTKTAGTKSKKQTTKSKTHGHVKSAPAKKKQKLSGIQSNVDSSAPLGVVDPAANLTDGSKIATLDGAPADAMLVLVDPEQNSDKYFVLQCIERGNDEPHKYCVFSRWGRTGTVGQALLQDFDDAAAAEQAFEAKFRQKTGLTWAERNEPYQGCKYRFIVQDFVQKHDGYANGQWQYYVDDGVDGKVTGWYDYDTNGSMQVEMLFHQNAQNAQLSQRQVASGIFTYHVDLDQMTQTNTSHPARKCRRIRRVVVNNDDEEGEEEADRIHDEGKEEEEEAERAPASAAVSTTMTTPPRPTRRNNAGAAAVPTPMVSPSPARRRAGGVTPPSSSSSSSSS
jgi:predicted DNA-binding WGR domain protein